MIYRRIPLSRVFPPSRRLARVVRIALLIFLGDPLRLSVTIIAHANNNDNNKNEKKNKPIKFDSGPLRPCGPTRVEDRNTGCTRVVRRASIGHLLADALEIRWSKRVTDR